MYKLIILIIIFNIPLFSKEIETVVLCFNNLDKKQVFLIENEKPNTIFYKLKNLIPQKIDSAIPISEGTLNIYEFPIQEGEEILVGISELKKSNDKSEPDEIVIKQRLSIIEIKLVDKPDIKIEKNKISFQLSSQKGKKIPDSIRDKVIFNGNRLKIPTYANALGTANM